METIFPPSPKLELSHSKIQSLYFFSIHSTKKSNLFNKPITIYWFINPQNTKNCPRLLRAINTSSSSNSYNESGSDLITQSDLDSLPLSVELQPILDVSQFDKVINDAQQVQESVVILWMANWCRKCIYLKPKLAKLAADYYPRVKFYSVDVNTVPHKLVVRAGVTKRTLYAIDHLFRAAAASRFRLPMSRVLLQIQDCNTPSLPEDVVIEILLMLPVKTLLRFKAVCKTWNTIISSSYFVDQHSRREGNHTHLLVCWRGMSEIRRPINPYDNDDDYIEVLESAQSFSLFPNGALESPPLDLGEGMFKAMGQGPDAGMVSAVCGPCNGIFCVSFHDDAFALWNPATRKLWPIPRIPYYAVTEVLPFSFWIDSLTNEFKIFWIGIFSIGKSRELRAFITYTSSNDSWKVLEAPIYDGDYVPSSEYGYSVLNGFYYFVRHTRNTNCDTVIAYDICKDLFEEIQMPKFEINLERRINLSLFGDSLALFVFENVNGGARAEILVMKEKECWIKLFNMDIPVEKHNYYEPLRLWTPNEVFILCITPEYENWISELMIYDRVSATSRKILVETREGLCSANLFPFSYKESLISFKIREARVGDLPVLGFDDINRPIELKDFDRDGDGVSSWGYPPTSMNESEWRREWDLASEIEKCEAILGQADELDDGEEESGIPHEIM